MKTKILTIAILLIAVIIGLNTVTNAATITINNSKTGHTYSAYQIFTGTLQTDGETLTDIEWGTGVNSATLLTALKATTDFKDVQSAEDVAAVLNTYDDDSEKIDEFAKIVSNHLATVTATSTKSGDTYTLSVANGYYFIKDSIDGTDTTDANSKYIIKVSNSVSIDTKTDIPTLTKTFSDDTTKNSINIGADASFKITTKVPEMDGYTSYTFEITDDITNFTYNDDMAIKIGNTILTKGTDYTVTQDGNKLKITFNNFINKKDQAGKTITVTYTAELKDTANIGNTPNTTTAFLTYSNDPYTTSSTATSTNSSTHTYLTKFKLIKQDYKDKTPLPNVVFEIYNGTTLVGTLTTDTNGEATLPSLPAGTYTLKEKTPPENYSKLKSDISLTISYTTNSTNVATWNVTTTAASSVATTTVAADGTINATVLNKKGITLPSTGGISGIIMTVLGIVVVLAGIFVIFKKDKKENN